MAWTDLWRNFCNENALLCEASSLVEVSAASIESSLELKRDPMTSFGALR
jgi:hypothetical protein